MLNAAALGLLDDYEDGVLYLAAKQAGATCIVTRNKPDFQKVFNGSLLIQTPGEFLTTNPSLILGSSTHIISGGTPSGAAGGPLGNMPGGPPSNGP